MRDLGQLEKQLLGILDLMEEVHEGYHMLLKDKEKVTQINNEKLKTLEEQ